MTQEKFVRNFDVVDADIDEDKILMDMETENYFGLNPVAKRIWELLAEPLWVDDLIDSLIQEYEVSEGQCRSDVQVFLDEMRNKKLISYSER